MKAIIFDFDGTIADSFSVFIEVSHQITHHPLFVDPAEVQALRKLSLVKIIERLQIPRWQWPFLIFRLRRGMAQRLNEIAPHEGISKVLAALKADGYQLYIMTSNKRQTVETFLAAHNLNSYFLKVYGGVGLLGKARALRKILKRQSLSVETTIYVGDESRDIEASKEVGMPCVSVGWGFCDPQLLREHQPLVVVQTSTELLRVLQDWGQTS